MVKSNYMIYNYAYNIIILIKDRSTREKMSKYKLIALDLDGTLKNSKNKITEKTKNALIKAQELGIAVVLASGRPTAGLREEEDKLKLREYGGFLLSFNGAKVIECKSGQTIYEKTLEVADVKRIYDQAKKYNLTIMGYDNMDLIVEDENGDHVKSEASMNGMNVKVVDDFKDYMNFRTNKILMSEKPKYLEEVMDSYKEPFGDKLSIYRSSDFYLEVMAKDIDKSYSLDQIVKILGINQEEVIAFGDGHNDLSMLQYAGHGVAMGNSNDELKKKANEITLSNDEDGIAYSLSKLIKEIEF